MARKTVNKITLRQPKFLFFLQSEIRYFTALHDVGYCGAIFNEGNCLVHSLSFPLPSHAQPACKLLQMMRARSAVRGNTTVLSNSPKFLHVPLQATWSTPLRVFRPSRTVPRRGPTPKPNQSHTCPGSLHAVSEPSYACSIAALFALPDLAPHEIVVEGEYSQILSLRTASYARSPQTRLVTRLARAPHCFGSATSQGTGERGSPLLAVWTTDVGQRESMAMRLAELTASCSG